MKQKVGAVIQTDSGNITPALLSVLERMESDNSLSKTIHVVYTCSVKPKIGDIVLPAAAKLVYHVMELEADKLDEDVMKIVKIPGEVTFRDKGWEIFKEMSKTYDTMYLPALFAPIANAMPLRNLVSSLLWNPFLISMIVISYTSIFVEFRKVYRSCDGVSFVSPRSSWRYTATLNAQRGDHCIVTPKTQDMGMDFVLRSLKQFRLTFIQFWLFTIYYVLFAIAWWAIVFKGNAWVDSFQNKLLSYVLERDIYGFFTNTVYIAHVTIVYFLFARINTRFPWHSLELSVILHPIYLTMFPFCWILSALYTPGNGWVSIVDEHQK